MCLPLGPSRARPYRPDFGDVEDYISYLDKNPIATCKYYPLPKELQSTPNFVQIVEKHPEIYDKIPQRYQNGKVYAAAHPKT